ncbi:MAG: hypothetical protein ACRENE_06950 [Polyangiaceae bacterium]
MVIRGRELLALLVVGLVGSAGCAQVLGLGSYGPDLDGGEDSPTTDGTTPPNDTGQPGDATTDVMAMNEASGNETSTVDAHPDSPHADAGPDAQGTETGPGDAGGSDAMTDGPVFATDACSGANTCAPAAPSGWSGPVELWEGTGAAPSCSAFYIDVFDGGTTPSGSPASCNCSCGPVSGATCGAAAAQFGTSGCASGCGSALSLTPGTCASVQSQVTACGSGASIALQGSTASGGGCQADASVDAAPAAWGNLTVACAPSSQSAVGCAANHVCIPAAASPFESTYCIIKAGNNGCPSPFTTQHLYYSDITDTRGCTGCSCGSAMNVDCNSLAHVTTWSNMSCNSGKGSDYAPIPVTCGPLGTSHYAMLNTAPTGGSCTPSGGTPTGGVTAANLTTICCL